MKNNYLIMGIYLFILVSFSSCSRELIEIDYEPPATTLLKSEYEITGEITGEITVDDLKRIFNIHESFENDPYKRLYEVVYCLNNEMPGAKTMLNFLSKFGKTVTLVYDPNSAPKYVNGYGDIRGNVIVLNSMEPDSIMEEFFHAFWAHAIFFNTGIIPEYLRFNAELDAKIYVTFVRHARGEFGPLTQYANTFNIFLEYFGEDASGYHDPGSYLKDYMIDEFIYQKLYDAFESDAEAIDSIYAKFGRTRGYTYGMSLGFYLLNAHPY